VRPAEQALDHGGKVHLEEQGHLTMVILQKRLLVNIPRVFVFFYLVYKF
jgi:hypothetical protein